MLRLLALVVCLLCASAHAQDARLSDRGRWLVSGSLRGSWSNNAAVQGQEQPLNWELRATPSVLYFVRDQIALGAYAGYGYTRDAFPAYLFITHGLAGGLQAGFELPLGPRLGWMLFPSAGFSWRRLTLEDAATAFFTAAGARTQQRNTLRNQRRSGHYDVIQFGLFAPLVFHVGDGLGFGFGPDLAVDWYLNQRDIESGQRYVHVRLGFGSWIGASF